jgi:hypothetical protein
MTQWAVLSSFDVKLRTKELVQNKTKDQDRELVFSTCLTVAETKILQAGLLS